MLVLAVLRWRCAGDRALAPGHGFATIRDDELAAEASGVPTLRLKLLATVMSGALMGMAGAPLPFYVTYLDPASAFSLTYAVNTIAMPLIGGTASWLGPADRRGDDRHAAAGCDGDDFLRANLLIVGLVLVGFVVAGAERDCRAGAEAATARCADCWRSTDWASGSAASSHWTGSTWSSRQASASG